MTGFTLKKFDTIRKPYKARNVLLGSLVSRYISRSVLFFFLKDHVQILLIILSELINFYTYGKGRNNCLLSAKLKLSENLF